MELDLGAIVSKGARGLDAYTRRPAAWQPLPHQVPPAGDWRGWVNLAGRGSGKTECASAYVTQHVNGPACISGHTPHWIGIIAPTLGDAVTACYAGPSGLRKHSPDAVLRQTAGGTVVRWPNGSQAKLFGAQSPEDVERLRAGGNTSLTGDTLVATEHGQRRIDQIVPGIRVWTRRGLRRVLWSGQTGVKRVWRLRTRGGKEVGATPDHKFWVEGRDWVELRLLRSDDVLVVRCETPSSEHHATPPTDERRVLVGALPSSPRERESNVTDVGASLRTASVRSVKQRFTSTATDQLPLAQDRVESVSVTSDVVPVYDIQVEYDHEFFANNVLTHNCLVWAEELAAWRYLDACWEQMRFGLRSGDRPHWIATTTPKSRPLIKKLGRETPRNVVVTRATTDDNPHLEQHVRDELYDDYGGLQIGRQELYAEILDEDANALWRRAVLDEFRVRDAPSLARITVGVDPSGGAGEQGIVVVGKHVFHEIVDGKLTTRAEGYVLDDRTCHLSPDGWGRRAVQAAVDWEADDVVVESNFGGDMAQSTVLGAAEALGVSIPVRKIVASRGKRPRAEPVAALAERGRWHHVGTFEQLEDQLCVASGTLVTTDRGEIPIEYVTAGTCVQTRAGYRPIIWCGETGQAGSFVRITTVDGNVLLCTPRHPIWVDNQFIDACNVRPCDIVLKCHTQSSVTTSSMTELSTLLRMVTCAQREVKEENFFTASSMSDITDRYHEATSFTTLITTDPITIREISSSCDLVSTSNITVTIQNVVDHTVRHIATGLRIGGRRNVKETLPASCATRRFRHAVRTPSTAPTVVRAVDIVTVHPTVPVYNLMVDGQHEFFANGLLTHNCTWTPELGFSPDRLDAMVWPPWHQRLVSVRSRGKALFGGSQATLRIVR